MEDTYFPQSFLKTNGLSLESVAGKLTYFVDQLHLLHWQTTSFAEHKALGELYEKMFDFKDDIVEKLMGYSSRRVKAFKIEGLKDYASGVSMSVVSEINEFAAALKEWADKNKYHDISNIADAVSGESAKIKYLLTLS